MNIHLEDRRKEWPEITEEEEKFIKSRTGFFFKYIPPEVMTNIIKKLRETPREKWDNIDY